MRVGIDLSPLSYGNRARGIGTYAENLVAALAQSDTTNEYVLLTASGAQSYRPPFALPQNFSLTALAALPLGRAAPLLSHQLVLPLRARLLGLDVLHSLAVPFNPSHPAVPYWQPVPTIVTIFDLLPLRMPSALLRHARYRYFYRFQLNACRRATHLITASEFTAQDLVSYGIKKRTGVSVIPLAASRPPPSTEVSDEVQRVIERGPYLLHVGGDEPQKNQATVLRAFGLLCRNPAFHHNLVLVGQHHLDDGLALDASTRAALRILRLRPNQADLYTLYAHCAAFVFPSLCEGFGLPVLEAMQAGAPVITSNDSSLPEVAGSAALLVAPTRVQELANAIRRVIEDERQRVKLVEAGERRASAFSWQRTAELTRRVYSSVAANS